MALITPGASAGVDGKELAQFLSRQVSWALYVMFWASRDPDQKLPVLLRARPRAGTASLLLYSVVKARPAPIREEN